MQTLLTVLLPTRLDALRPSDAAAAVVHTNERAQRGLLMHSR